MPIAMVMTVANSPKAALMFRSEKAIASRNRSGSK
jgi:hypothetical protein